MALKSIIVTIQGQDVELEYNSATGYYEKSVNAGSDSSFSQSGGYFTASIKATDDTDLSTTVNSSHATFGSNLRLFVVEKHKPQITILTPGSGGYITDNVKPEIKFEIYDNKVQTSGYSGINKDSIVLKIDGVAITNSAITFETVAGGYVGTYTPKEPLANGKRTITVDGADNDGNSAETASVTFEIDNQAPSLELYSPGDGYATSKAKVTVSGKTEDNNKPITVNITLNGVDQGAVTVASDGSFSKEIELKNQGNNVIKVKATDSVGNVSTEVTRNIRYNTTAPVFDEVSIIYNSKQVSATNKVPAGGAYLIRCKVTTS